MTNKFIKQAGFAEPHSISTIGWVLVGLGWVGLGWVLVGLGWGLAGVGLGFSHWVECGNIIHIFSLILVYTNLPHQSTEHKASF